MTVRPEFYEAAAQLIPLLLLAAAIDQRLWASDAPLSHAEAGSEVLSLILLTFAWFASLAIVASGEDSTAWFLAVAVSLAIAWMQIVGSIAVAQVGRIRRARVTLRLRAMVFVLVLAPLLGVVGMWNAT